MAQKKKTTEVKKEVAPVAEKGRSYRVDVDNTVEEVLKLDKDGAELLFDSDRFLELEDEEVRALSRGNFTNYVLAEQAKVQREKFEESDGTKGNSGIKIIDPLDGQARNKIKVKDQDKDGVHITFKRKDEIEGFRELGYERIKDDDAVAERVPGTRADASGYRVVKDRSGEVDLFPMKVKKGVQQEIQQAAELKSRYRIGRGKEDFKDYVKDRSRRLSGKHSVETFEE